MNRYGINKGDRYFVLMRPLRGVLGLVCYTTTTGEEEWVECEVVEENYRVDDNYKVELRALDEGFGKETFYQCDFDSLVKQGIHVVKKEPGMRIGQDRWAEPICPGVNLVHTASIIMA